jgi:hypothetical protein
MRVCNLTLFGAIGGIDGMSQDSSVGNRIEIWDDVGSRSASPIVDLIPLSEILPVPLAPLDLGSPFPSSFRLDHVDRAPSPSLYTVLRCALRIILLLHNVTPTTPPVSLARFSWSDRVLFLNPEQAALLAASLDCPDPVIPFGLVSTQVIDPDAFDAAPSLTNEQERWFLTGLHGMLKQRLSLSMTAVTALPSFSVKCSNCWIGIDLMTLIEKGPLDTKTAVAAGLCDHCGTFTVQSMAAPSSEALDGTRSINFKHIETMLAQWHEATHATTVIPPPARVKGIALSSATRQRLHRQRQDRISLYLCELIRQLAFTEHKPPRRLLEALFQYYI